ncbi:MAG: hypothetical protein COU32_02210 [Candidatus Magasanikbacteria bacterium CG10_big_fil_rev_8_21_14_0_10_42_10]|uniref:O-antigen ligase-related domain-containing protein n=1 Tax=Candidatus Magasanikbacteria bacterium CG10_big_fil_rev_8_21_14_0_10_42_10 TaxID=1974649 RepID=A0A2H0TW92_9BACT|nr:MAG: hypothetical protein COU32_02210 [Candidatus Magasanikbacteria bacterium CG10_big_fil_rev_8_21_14_0_10_42_10]
MPVNLTKQSIFLNKQTAWLLALFFALRIASFLLMGHAIIQGILVFGVIMLFAMLYFLETHYGWYLLLGEFFLGGSGNFFEFFGLSIRSILLITFLFLWLIQHIFQKKRRFRLRIDHRIGYALLAFGFFVIVSAVMGVLHGHGILQVMKDLVPFTYFVLLLPFYHYFYKQHTQEYFVRLLFVFLLGSALFSLVTFFIYSSGLGVIHDAYYTWFRDVAMGKITDVGHGFFRIVTPEHLLVVPALLMITSLIMRDEKHHKHWYTFLTLGILILVFELSRTYLLALFIGLLVLKYTHTLKNWGKVCILTFAIFFGIFISTSIIASRFSTTGLELLGFRFASIAEPSLETSTYTRTALLQPTFALIAEHPIVGNGLGSTITFVNPDTYEYITTGQFDWGYLELLAEFGILGLLPLFILFILVSYELIQKIASLSDYHDFYVGLLGGFIALFVMTITAPVLFHVLGVLYFTLLLAIVMKPLTIFDSTLTMLYRIFNHTKHDASSE